MIVSVILLQSQSVTASLCTNARIQYMHIYHYKVVCLCAFVHVHVFNFVQMSTEDVCQFSKQLMDVEVQPPAFGFL